ncbi:MAG: superoxide dismutase, Fe-Mn family [Patescibacteria group bacterium]|nr:superoxide dismutase, Fe-Mn family [Patescibacteria group bacterium]
MFTLMTLPYEKNALSPYMSEETINFHYGKHHQAYIDNLNKLIAGTDWESLSLEEIIINSYQQVDKTAIFNNAAQVYNHNFFWQSLSPDSKEKQLPENLQEALIASFGSLEEFQAKFKATALAQFGSGWVWLVKGENGLEIIKTANAENPLVLQLKPLFALDVWEHSYYLDYQNRRADFVEAVLSNLVNWHFVAGNL